MASSIVARTARASVAVPSAWSIVCLMRAITSAPKDAWAFKAPVAAKVSPVARSTSAAATVVVPISMAAPAKRPSRPTASTFCPRQRAENRRTPSASSRARSASASRATAAAAPGKARSAAVFWSASVGGGRSTARTVKRGRRTSSAPCSPLLVTASVGHSTARSSKTARRQARRWPRSISAAENARRSQSDTAASPSTMRTRQLRHRPAPPQGKGRGTAARAAASLSEAPAGTAAAFPEGRKRTL